LNRRWLRAGFLVVSTLLAVVGSVNGVIFICVLLANGVSLQLAKNVDLNPTQAYDAIGMMFDRVPSPNLIGGSLLSGRASCS
jgi:hypothetical protein